MPPNQGNQHRAARSDSGVARLWAWARRRKRAWDTVEAAEAVGISRSRCRGTVQALREAGAVVEVEPVQHRGGREGTTLARYCVRPEAAAVEAAPILIMRDGKLVGVRFPDPV